MLRYQQHYSLGILPSLDDIDRDPEVGTTVFIQEKPGAVMTMYVFDGQGWVRPAA